MDVVIKKDGFYSNNQKLNENVIYYLKYPCKIEENVTLKDVMTHTKNNKSLEIVVGLLSHCPNIAQFNKEIENTNLAEEHKDYILRVVPFIDVFQNEISIEFVFDAFHKTTKQLIGFDATPIPDYADLPIIIDNNVVYSDDDNNDAKKLILEVTLIDFLSAIYFELGFYGSTPKKVLEFFENTTKLLKQYQEQEL